MLNCDAAASAGTSRRKPPAAHVALGGSAPAPHLPLLYRTPHSKRSALQLLRHLSHFIYRTAVYGPVCTVVWEGRSRETSPYPDRDDGFGLSASCRFPLRVKATVQLMNLFGQIGKRAFHHDAWDNVPDWKGTDRRRFNPELDEPASQLFGRTRIYDAAEPHPTMRGGAHRAVLT
jgi:hypothetical protein